MSIVTIQLCKLCGGDAEFREKYHRRHNGGLFIIKCTQCGVSVMRHNMNAAVIDWNNGKRR
jgi:hypothetical protein